MIKILIVDDKQIDIIKETLEVDGSVLKNKCTILTSKFPTKIPSNQSEFYTQDSIAINIINKENVIDLAILDIGFPDEGMQDYYGAVKILINELRSKYPFCQIIIMTQANSLPLSPDQIQKITIGDTEYMSIPKDTTKASLNDYDRIYSICLDYRLKFLLNECTISQKSEIKYFLTNTTSKSKTIIINDIEFSLESLFCQFYVDDCFIDKPEAYKAYLEHLIDVPSFEDKVWLKEGAKGYRLYPLKDYYFQYSNYYSEKNKQYSFNIIYNNAKYAIESIINFIEDSSLIKSTCEIWVNTPINSYRNLKLTSKKYTNNRIPDGDMMKFSDFLFNRLLVIGLYFGVNLTSTGINYLIHKNSLANDLQRCRKFVTFLYFSIPEQLSTETDILISKLTDINAIDRRFNNGDEFIQENFSRKQLKQLSPIEREYDKIFQQLANYEKAFLRNICKYALNKCSIDLHRQNLEYIITNLESWDN